MNTTSLNHFDLYQRQISLPDLGLIGQKALAESRVAIVGVGGLGCPVAQSLVRAGVGFLTLIDPDCVDVSNLHRQTLFGQADLGEAKVLAARRALKSFPSGVQIETKQVALDVSNARQLIADHHIVIDCVDNLSSRLALSDACVSEAVPCVYGAVYQWEGRVGIFCGADLPCYRCFHPPGVDAQTCDTCSEAGVIGAVPAIVGHAQALETIKYLTNIGTPTLGKLRISNFLTMESMELDVLPQSECGCGEMIPRKIQSSEVDNQNKVKTINAHTLKQWQGGAHEVCLLDVRTGEERSAGIIAGASPFGFEHLEAAAARNVPVVLYCHSGRRSQLYGSQLASMYPMLKLYSLEDGIQGWIDSESVAADAQVSQGQLRCESVSFKAHEYHPNQAEDGNVP